MASRAKATILDIAREAGVSKSTVSLVLQGSGLIRPETAVKVRKAIEDVGYVYNRGAANLRKAHSNVIGMVINDLTNPFFAELAVGMERVFQSAGIVPFIANTAENPVRQEEVLKSLMEQGVAGLIVSPARGTHAGRLPPPGDGGRSGRLRHAPPARQPHPGDRARQSSRRLSGRRPSDRQGPSPAGLLRRLVRPGGLSRAAGRLSRSLRDAWHRRARHARRRGRDQPQGRHRLPGNRSCRWPSRRPRPCASTTPSPSASCWRCASAGLSRARISPSSASTTWSRPSITCRR